MQRRLLIIAAFLALCHVIVSPSSAQDSIEVQQDFQTYLEYFTNFKTRMVGSEENRVCAEFIESEFKKLGLEDVQAEEVEVVVPVDKGGTLQLLGTTMEFPLRTLWPNNVRTSTTPEDGIEGHLIYAGRGDYSDYNGKELEGSIVLLDFGCDDNYIKARSLGAEAILLFDNGYVNHTQAVYKFLEVPADIPRYWVDADVAAILREKAEQGDVRVRLDARMDFEQVKTWNVYGFRHGSLRNVMLTLDDSTRKRLKKALESDETSALRIADVENEEMVELAKEEFDIDEESGIILVADEETAVWLESQEDLNEDFKVVICEPKMFRDRFLKESSAWNLIALDGYYDSTSIVPSLAPGAEAACSVSSLLSLAKNLDNSDSQHSLMFLAAGDHFGGLHGVSDFLYWHTRKRKKFVDKVPQEEKIPINLFVSLDISSKNDKVASTAMGCYFYEWQHVRIWDMNKNKLAPYAKLFDEYEKDLIDCEWEDPDDPCRRHINAINPPKKMWRTYFATPMAFDSEVASHMGIDAITFFTPYDPRPLVFTPRDTFDKLNLPNVLRQVETIEHLLSRTLQEEDLFVEGKLRIGDNGRDLIGSVYEFDRRKRFVPEDKIPGALVTYRHSEGFLRHTKDVGGVKSDQMVFSLVEDATLGLMEEELEAGEFFIKNILPVDGSVNPANTISFYAHLLDDRGRVTAMTDLGQDGKKSYPNTARTMFELNKTMVMLFPCKTMTIYDIVDSRQLRALDSFFLKTSYDAEPRRFGLAAHLWQYGRQRGMEPVVVLGVEDNEPVKIIGSTGAYGVKYLLTNSPDRFLTDPVKDSDITTAIEDESAGGGYEAVSSLSHCAYKAARDMWVLDDIRIKGFTQYGIRNDRLAIFHNLAREALLDAKMFLKQKLYDRYMASVQRGWGLEARGYPDVKATMHDTVKGVLFYFALMVPFSIFMERLIFGFSNIKKRIGGFSLFLLAIFMIMRKVHPAFKLSSSPYVIFLAFVIMMLTGVVLMIIIAKFGDEIQKIRAAGTGVSEVDVGRASAAKAAIFIGISNLRKRKLRTTITAFTVTLLTFSVQSFTSVSSTMKFYKIPVSETPAYQGCLMRDLNWNPMQECSLDYLRGAFGSVATVIPRAFNTIRSMGQMEYFRVKNIENDQTLFALGFCGLTPEETQAIDYESAFLGNSRWFESDREKSCILSNQMATDLGIEVDEIGKTKLSILGEEFTLCGILDSDKYNELKDLDDERPTPLDTVAQQSMGTGQADEQDIGKAALQLKSFWHIESNNTVILPYKWVMDNGGVLESIAITNFHDEHGMAMDDFLAPVEDFMMRIATTMFVGKGDSVKVYSSIGQTTFSGMGKLIIPIIIAALIVLNTMMGSVHERKSEIGVYSSVGLAPTHIGALFVAESAVFATVGAVLGYLLGQVVSHTFMYFGWLAGLEMNYSSTSAIYSAAIVMIVVFLSSLYPARIASALAVPDVTRKWRFPDPEGDVWKFDFPFTVAGSDVLAMSSYLANYFNAYTESSLGDFFSRNVKLSGNLDLAEPEYVITMQTWLSPYDLGVSQDVELKATSTGEHNIYKIEITIVRKSGQVVTWRRINRGFLNVLRKRCLIWRTITKKQKEEYREEGMKLLGITDAEG